MNNDKPTFKRLLTESMDEEAKSLHRHPARQELLDFRGGNLAQDAENELMAHLGLCRDCSGRLLAMSREGIGARLWAWLSGGGLFGPYSNAVVGLAAAVLLLLPAVKWQQAEMRIAALSRPQVNFEIFHVDRQSRGSEAAPKKSTFELEAGDHRFLVVLPAAGEFDVYEVRILQTDGRELWKSRELQPDALGLLLRLELSRYSLDAGDYLFEVSGLAQGEPMSTVVYDVTLLYR